MISGQHRQFRQIIANMTQGIIKVGISYIKPVKLFPNVIKLVINTPKAMNTAAESPNIQLLFS